jgi:hypothetical protein
VYDVVNFLARFLGRKITPPARAFSTLFSNALFFSVIS